MATLKNQTIADTYDQLVKRQDSYSSTGNRIEIMNDSGTMVSTSLYLDAVNGRVGMGISNPATDLDIASNTPTITLTDLDATNDAFCTIAGLTGSLVFKADADSDIASETMQWWMSGSQKMTLLASGNLGIGETDPHSLLMISASSADTTEAGLVNVNSGIADPCIVLHNTNDTDGNYGAIAFSTSGDSAATEQAYALIVGKTIGRSGTYAHGNLSFWTTNTGGTLGEAMRIDEVGNVGIGSTDPESVLHIQSASAPRLMIDSEGTSGGAARGYLDIKDGNNDGWRFGYYGDSSGQPLRIVSFDNDVQTNHVAILASGNVGIGTTAPDFPLHIEAAAAVTVQASTTAQTDTNYCRFQAKSIHTGGSNTVYAEIGNYQHSATETGDSAVGYIRLQPGDRSYNAYLWIEDDDTLKGSSTLAHIGTTSGIAISAAVTSDERLKDIDSSPFPYGLSDINKLTPIKYKLKDKKVDKLGFGAQTMRDIIPEPVTDTDICIDGYSWEYDEDGNELGQKPNSEGKEAKLTMEYHQLIPVLVKAIQELTAKVEALENK